MVDSLKYHSSAFLLENRSYTKHIKYIKPEHFSHFFFRMCLCSNLCTLYGCNVAKDMPCAGMDFGSKAEGPRGWWNSRAPCTWLGEAYGLSLYVYTYMYIYIYILYVYKQLLNLLYKWNYFNILNLYTYFLIIIIVIIYYCYYYILCLLCSYIISSL